jgi:glutamate-5-semialdehyde dehydrogenase
LEKTVNIKEYMTSLGQQAKTAGREVSRAESGQKNAALLAIAEQLKNNTALLAEENAKDLQAGKEKGLDAALLDRLELTPARIQAMIDGLNEVAALPDPVGAMTDLKYRPSGIQVGQMRVPLGVIGIIYESRPNVTVDAAALCLKSGNACILRGGSESIHYRHDKYHLNA